MMSEPLIEKSVYSELCETMGDDFAAELVTTFLDEAPGMFSELKRTLADKDADGFRRAAHSIKSNAEVFGARQLAAQARDLELGGLPEDDTAVTSLTSTMSTTADALRAVIDA